MDLPKASRRNSSSLLFVNLSRYIYEIINKLWKCCSSTRPGNCCHIKSFTEGAERRLRNAINEGSWAATKEEGRFIAVCHYVYKQRLPS